MNTKWKQNGNGLLVYPGEEGPVPSIRLELLRDGMEDYEYLALLARAVDQHRASADPALIAEAKRLLAVDPALVESMRTYARDGEGLERNRRAIAKAIVQLQRVVVAPPVGTSDETL